MKKKSKNCDTTDNRKRNLRVVTKQQNVMNRKQITGRYKGVSLSKHANKWRATSSIEGKQKHLGYYDTEEEAAIAYNDFVEEYFPETDYKNCVLNSK